METELLMVMLGTYMARRLLGLRSWSTAILLRGGGGRGGGKGGGGIGRRMEEGGRG